MARKVHNHLSLLETLEHRLVLAAEPLAALPGPMAPAAAVVSTDRFGNVGGQHDVKLKTDVGGTDVEFRLTGPGVGRLRFLGGRYIVNLTGTTDQTDVTITAHAKKGDPTPVISAINAPKSLHDLKVDGVDLAKRVSIKGTAHKIEADDVRNAQITIEKAAAGQAAQIKLGSVSNTTITSAGPLSSLEAKSWADAGGAKDRINAPSIDRVKIDGNFGACLVLKGWEASGRSINTLDVKGAMTGDLVTSGFVGDVHAGSLVGARIMINRAVHELKVDGSVVGSMIAAHNMRTVDLHGDVIDSHVITGATFASVNPEALFAGTKSIRFANGMIKDLKIGGDMVRSSVTASVRPMDGKWLNGNDRFVPSAFGRLSHVEVRGSMIDSGFAAPNMPGKAKIDGHDVTTASSPDFFFHLA